MLVENDKLGLAEIRDAETLRAIAGGTDPKELRQQAEETVDRVLSSWTPPPDWPYVDDLLR